MLDISTAYNRYQFLGHEFLTWLWFIIEEDQTRIKGTEQGTVSLEIGNRLVLENLRKESGETITIKGDDAGLEEGILALRKGAVVTEVNLVYEAGEQQWHFTIKGDGLDIVSFKTPQTGPIESRKDIEGAVIEKVSLYDKAIQFIENLFSQFIKLRISNEWNEKVVPMVRQWMYA